MRLKIFAMFLFAGVPGMCQSVTPASKTSARVDENRQRDSATDCNKASPDFSISRLAPRQRERRFEVPAWNWDDAQVDSKSAFHPPLLVPTAKSCPLFATNGESTFDQGPHRQWFQAKLEPIPTEWPNAKFEPIPTDWPSLKVLPMAFRPGTPTTMSIPTK